MEGETTPNKAFKLEKEKNISNIRTLQRDFLSGKRWKKA